MGGVMTRIRPGFWYKRVWVGSILETLVHDSPWRLQTASVFIHLKFPKTRRRRRIKRIGFWILRFRSQTQMGRRQTDSELGRCALLALLFLGATSCCVVYTLLSAGLRRTPTSSVLDSIESGDVLGREEAQCCRGIEHLELWGDAVKWGADFKVNSSEECCRACKAMCSGVDGPCLCDSWVFCGNREACGAKFGEVCCPFLALVSFSVCLVKFISWSIMTVDFLL